ncbi:hypothetical protein STAS_09185 [Striga asiatica]|uniref:Uncharacterized protein n=1 Tax=Striga asiatica TaxID=4170 RepID=A0A5A7PKE1_STRAF|nr:hypothetical protein STAS_09185 [Striga asiatica]
MELEFDKYCVVDGSPTTVLPAPRHHYKAIYQKSDKKVKCLNEKFTEISFNRYRSASCRDARPTRSNPTMHKRDSVYQSSKDINLLSKTDCAVGRQKIELSRESAPLSFPLGIIDSLCSSDEDGSLEDQSRSSEVSTSEQSTSSYSMNYSFLRKNEERSFDSNSSKLAKDRVIKSEFSLSSVKDSDRPRERQVAINFQKSLSSKLSLPHSPAWSENDGSKTNSPNATFNLSPKKFDRPVKSRSHRRSPLSRETSGDVGSSFTEPICKRPSKDFSDNLNSVPPSSPAHLHGLLKSEDKNGLPFFQFSVNSPEEVSYIVKTWKVDDALMWVYTFHSLNHKRKSNASGGGWGFKDINRESTMVGQMVVSCYLRTELKAARTYTDYMVQEYVLYDVAQSRRSTSSQDNSSCFKEQIFKHSRPLMAVDLHPELEIAAVIMRAPFEKRESLKFKSGDGEMDRPLPSLLDLCRLEEAREGILGNSRTGEMHVVVPAGNHSLPGGENRGPSPLLDRWRMGGGCDCGGWDMACPLDVFVNPNFRICDEQPLVDSRHPVELFVQGRKNNNIPAFTMRAVEDGKYAVDFHAQLSSLQAFSICVAILHAANTSTAIEHETNKRMLKSDSLKVFAEEEIKNLMDSISEEENFKANSKKDEVLTSFVLNPPFSPIARV